MNFLSITLFFAYVIVAVMAQIDLDSSVSFNCKDAFEKYEKSSQGETSKLCGKLGKSDICSHKECGRFIFPKSLRPACKTESDKKALADLKEYIMNYNSLYSSNCKDEKSKTTTKKSKTTTKITKTTKISKSTTEKSEVTKTTEVDDKKDQSTTAVKATTTILANNNVSTDSSIATVAPASTVINSQDSSATPLASTSTTLITPQGASVTPIVQGNNTTTNSLMASDANRISYSLITIALILLSLLL
jgi:hypothetical protein